MNAATASRVERPAEGGYGRARQRLPWLERTAEEILGNRLGAGVYRRWVNGLEMHGDERVLEIGAGAGACSRHLAEALPSGFLTCLEVDARWLMIARTRLAAFERRVEFVHADAAEWCRPGVFDVAVAHFVLHDIPAQARIRALHCIARSLGARGCLCVREPLGHGMTAEELHAQLEAVGFELVGAETREHVPLMGETVSAVWQLWP